ncbi:hypothetical protein SS50377_27074 [Spironucleus salmonicida]|uniref:EF-hand domain-containing protein n=1 Tax=Spironucleus salmonicida TaxID=348837 RepID=V6LTS4_9EUKA|nr:hypothetical protein SS50377_27074 [Spironucleus salmonicida]|eukprot:EST48057.1 Hypothetical protein SS50377_11823 [Spironucleus salmonicida]
MLPFNLYPPKIDQFSLPQLPPPPTFPKLSPRLTDEQQYKFSQADVLNLNKGQPHLLFPALTQQSITHLTRCFSDECYLTKFQFLDAEHFLSRIKKVYNNERQPFQLENLISSANLLGLNQNIQVLSSLYEKYERNDSLDFNGVTAIFCFLRLSQRLLEKFDKQNKGYVNLDLKELMNLCFWMI